MNNQFNSMNYPPTYTSQQNIRNPDTNRPNQSERRTVLFPYAPMIPYKASVFHNSQVGGALQGCFIQQASGSILNSPQSMKYLQSYILQQHATNRQISQWLKFYQMAYQQMYTQINYWKYLCQGLHNEKNKLIQAHYDLYLVSPAYNLQNQITEPRQTYNLHEQNHLPIQSNLPQQINLSNQRSLYKQNKLPKQNTQKLKQKEIIGTFPQKYLQIQTKDINKEINFQKQRLPNSLPNHQKNKNKQRKNLKKKREMKVAILKDQSQEKKVTLNNDKQLGKKTSQQFKYYHKFQQTKQGRKQYKKKLRDRQTRQIQIQQQKKTKIKQFQWVQLDMAPKALKKLKQKFQAEKQNSQKEKLKFQNNQEDFKLQVQIHLDDATVKDQQKDQTEQNILNKNTLNEVSAQNIIVKVKKQFLSGDDVSEQSQQGKIDLQSIPQYSILKPLLQQERKQETENQKNQNYYQKRSRNPKQTIPTNIKTKNSYSKEITQNNGVNQIQKSQKEVQKLQIFKQKQKQIKIQKQQKHWFIKIKQQDFQRLSRQRKQLCDLSNQNQANQIQNKQSTIVGNQIDHKKIKLNQYANFNKGHQKQTHIVKKQKIQQINKQNIQHLPRQLQQPFKKQIKELSSSQNEIQLDDRQPTALYFKFDQNEGNARVLQINKIQKLSIEKQENKYINQQGKVVSRNKIQIQSENVKLQSSQINNQQNNNRQGSKKQEKNGKQSQSIQIKVYKKRGYKRKSVIFHYDQDNTQKQEMQIEKLKKCKKVKIPCLKDDTFLIVKNWRQYQKYSNYGFAFEAVYKDQSFKKIDKEAYDKDFSYKISKKMKKEGKIKGKYFFQKAEIQGWQTPVQKGQIKYQILLESQKSVEVENEKVPIGQRESQNSQSIQNQIPISEENQIKFTQIDQADQIDQINKEEV